MDNNREARSRARRENLRRLRRGGIPAWGFLVFFLILVLMFFIYTTINSKKPARKPEKKPAPITADSYILEDTYINNIYGFRISLPTKDWRFKILEDTTPLQSEKKDSNLSYLAQRQNLLRLDRLDKDEFLAWVDVGVVPLPGPRSARKVAVESYMESYVEDSYRDVETETMLKPTTYASGPLKSAYYIVRSPAKAPFDTKVVVFVVKDQKAFVMVANVRQKDYDTYRWDFEQIFNSFSFLAN